MCDRKIEIDETRQQRFDYPETGLPVPRICNMLNDFSRGRVEFHWHTEFQFGLVLKGRLDYLLFRKHGSKVQRTLTAGDGFFINSGVLHGYSQLAPGAEIFIFSIAPSFFASSLVFGNIYQKIILPALHSQIPGLFFDHTGTEHGEMLKLLRSFHDLEPSDTDYELHGLELICRIWRSLSWDLFLKKSDSPSCTFSSIQERRMQQMLDFIHKHYPEPLTVEAIARAAHTNKRECFRCFRSSLSQTPVEYLNRYRLSVAAYLLTSTTQNLASICKQCGFNNVSYFGKLFRQNYGTSPSRYRIMAR